MRGVPGTKNIHISKFNGYTYYHVKKSINGKIKFCGAGRTLIEALMIRDWVEANGLKKYPNKSFSNTGEKYIYKNKKSGNYNIIKTINRKSLHYGTVNNLQEAIKYRDLLIEHDWDIKYRLPFKRICDDETRFIQKTRHDNYCVVIQNKDGNECLGTYNNLEDAIEIRDLFLKYDGDWDLICEYNNPEDNIIWLGQECGS